MSKFQVNRGTLSAIPVLGEGEFYFATDTGGVYMGTALAGNLLVFPTYALLDAANFNENDFIKVVGGAFVGAPLSLGTLPKKFIGNFTQAGTAAPAFGSIIDNTTGLATPTRQYLQPGEYTFTFSAPLADTLDKISIAPDQILNGFGEWAGMMIWDKPNSTTSVFYMRVMTPQGITADDLIENFATLNITIKS